MPDEPGGLCGAGREFEQRTELRPLFFGMLPGQGGPTSAPARERSSQETEIRKKEEDTAQRRETVTMAEQREADDDARTSS